MNVVARGEDPKCTLRKGVAPEIQELPHPNAVTRGGSESRDVRFPFLAGQPPEIAEIYRKVKETWFDSSIPMPANIQDQGLSLSGTASRE
jgi:hypothetical protein